MPKQSTTAQRITELICKREAANRKKTLPDKFWNDPEFSRNYRLQLIKANALLKIYSATAILNALNSKEGERIWSLTAKWLDPIMAREQKKLDSIERQQEEYILKKACESFNEGVSPPQPPPNAGVDGEMMQGPKEKPKSLLERLD